jgi:hypothetical protein
VTGICCLAISLAVKPQDTGIVWLYLLLAGGVLRKRAIQALLAWTAISLPALIWVGIASPNWMQELRSNIHALSIRGGINDPGLGSAGAHGLSRIISLQSVFSIVRDEPKFYNSAALIFIAPLFLVWAYSTMRKRPSQHSAWIAIAAAVPLAMLPVYHRQYDAILILLTVPACTLLFAEGGLIGRLALAMNAIGFLFVGVLPWVAFRLLTSLIIQPSDPHQDVLRIVLAGVEVLTTPIAILAMGSFYLWVYVRCNDAPDKPARTTA